MRRALVLVVALPLVLGGCVELYRAEVDPAVVARAPQDWQVTRYPVESKGMWGPKSTETRYSLTPPSAQQPPFPGVLQLFSLTTQEAPDTTALRELLEEQVDEAMAREGIAELRTLQSSGERTVASGANSQFFVRGGTVQDSGGFFARDVEVRILGEVWRDDKSSTSVIIVAMAQTAVQQFLGDERDLRTWRLLAGDPKGSIDGQVHQNGFVYNVVSHG